MYWWLVDLVEYRPLDSWCGAIEVIHLAGLSSQKMGVLRAEVVHGDVFQLVKIVERVNARLPHHEGILSLPAVVSKS